MAKILCVLYDDPIHGYPKTYARNDLPIIEQYPDGQSIPTPRHLEFKPGTLLGSVSGELGLRQFLESQGHQFIVTSDKKAQTLFSKKNYLIQISLFHNLFGPPT
ncbi:NAD+-dependent formate dehydrogenase [Legionella sainthelensi]|nr:NAD+-dependent formate dehydrogenase [Legionella sainthelensi]